MGLGGGGTVVGSEETREGKWMSVRVRGGLAATGGGGQTVSVSSCSKVDSVRFHADSSVETERGRGVVGSFGPGFGELRKSGPVRRHSNVMEWEARECI
jgi:hypothetical protein